MAADELIDDYPGGWFGPDWGAPVCDPARHKPTPVGDDCIECHRSIVDGDAGFLLPYLNGAAVELLAYHRICFLRTVIPCGRWSAEMLADLPPRWETHLAEHHPELLEQRHA